MLLTLSKTQTASGSIAIGGTVGVLRTNTATYDLTIDELEHLRPTLVSLQQAGLITWSTAPNTQSADNAAEGATVALTGGGGDRANDLGSFASVAAMPNSSGAPSTTLPRPGDRCFLTSTGVEYICLSAGTTGGANALWAPNTGQGAFSSVLYVDNVRGNDSTGQRGNANRPYATPQAAVNAAVTDDTIRCAPQRFALDNSITIPATIARISFEGTRIGVLGSTSSGSGSGTLLRCATDHAFNLGTNLGLTKVTVLNMAVATGNAAKAAIFADGSLYAVQTFLSTGLFLDGVDISTTGAPLSLKYPLFLRIINCRLNGSVGLSITNIFGVQIQKTNSATMGWVFNYDITDPLSPQLQPTIRIEDATTMGGQSSAGYVQIGGVYRMWVDQASLLGGLKASATLPLAVSASPAASCGVAICGYFGGSGSGVVDFASAGLEIPDTATALVFDFRGARFYGVGGAGLSVDGQSTLQFKVGGSATNFQTVQLDNTSLLPGKTVSAQSKIHITGRGARWPNVVLATPSADGDIVPPELSGTIDLSAGGAVTKTWSQLGYASLVRVGSAPDGANATPNIKGSDTAITAKLTTGLSFDSNAVANNACNWRAWWK